MPVSDQDYNALLAEHNTLRKEYAEMRGAQPARELKQGSGCFWIAVSAFCVVITLFALLTAAIQFGWVPPLLLGEGLNAQAKATTQQQQKQTTFTGGGGSTSGGASHSTNAGAPLPPCSSVTDTTTACQQDSEPTPAVCQPAPAPEGVPICGETEQPPPAYVSACVTEPGARPCWLPADQPWEAPADVPATPIVLLPEPTAVPLVFSDAACAAWHPPLPYPDECRSE